MKLKHKLYSISDYENLKKIKKPVLIELVDKYGYIRYRMLSPDGKCDWINLTDTSIISYHDTFNRSCFVPSNTDLNMTVHSMIEYDFSSEMRIIRVEFI